MDFIIQLTLQAAGQVWVTLTHNWLFLIISIVVAVSLKLLFDPQKVSALLSRYQGSGVIGATLLAVGTPLCSCGTTAVVLGMIASTIPWAPIVAFMVSSPLTSPEELIYSAGLLGWPFALAFFISSILLGLLGGLVGWYFDRRGWLKNQARFQNTQSNVKAPASGCNCGSNPAVAYRSTLRLAVEPDGACACSPIAASPINSCACGSSTAETRSIQPAASSSACDCEIESHNEKAEKRIDWKTFLLECGSTGWRLLVMFLVFAFIGYFINGLIPAEWVAAIFGKGNIYSVPLAATLGLPFYINTEASLPLIKALIDGGMSQGAALAFLITGAGVSVGTVTGGLAIARWRVITLVIVTLWVGAMASGFLFDLLLASGII